MSGAWATGRQAVHSQGTLGAEGRPSPLTSFQQQMETSARPLQGPEPLLQKASDFFKTLLSTKFKFS